MALILNIETSSAVCSVCLSRDSELIAEKEDASGTNHASLLTVFIQQLFRDAQLEIHQLDAIAVSSGPGSYTGLRIGVVTAKGLCFTLEKPLIAIDSLQAFSMGMIKKYPPPQYLYCPTIDARRNEIYFGVFGHDAEEVIASSNMILSDAIPFKIPADKKVVVSGTGALKCSKSWQSPFLIFDNEIFASAHNMIELSKEKFNLGEYENAARFEPNYIKPVYITASAKKYP